MDNCSNYVSSYVCTIYNLDDNSSSKSTYMFFNIYSSALGSILVNTIL